MGEAAEFVGRDRPADTVEFTAPLHVAKIGAGDAGATQLDTTPAFITGAQDCAVEIHFLEVRFVEVGADECCSVHIHAVQIGAREIAPNAASEKRVDFYTGKLNVFEIGASDADATYLRVAECCVAEIRAGERDAAQVCAVKSGAAEVDPDKFCIVKVGIA